MKRALCLSLYLLASSLPVGASRQTSEQFDVVVVGATPAGVSAALAAARLGSRVALVDSSNYIGGMFTRGGMTYSDLWFKNSEGALFMEYVRRVRQHYTGKQDPPQDPDSVAGYMWEPFVADRVFHQMLEEQRSLQVMLNYRLNSVLRKNSQITGAEFETPGGQRYLLAKVFVDATYEGDLAALAGVEYRIGRESRSEFNEQHAGVIYQDVLTKRLYPGSSGRGDKNIMSYISLLVVTDRADNKAPIQRPAGYDRSQYLTLLDDLKQGKAKGLHDFYFFIPAPGQKYCLNNSYKVSISADLPEANREYTEGNPEARRRIADRYQAHTLGLLYFLQNDQEVPAELRRQAGALGLAADEFTDNNHLPSQLYVREARRIVGEYTFTENDARDDPAGRPEPGHPIEFDSPYMYPPYDIVNLVKRTLNLRPPIHSDSVAVSTYFLDSHAVHRWKPGHEDKTRVFEGVLHLDQLTLPSQLPYRIMVPAKVDGLLVPVAVSATHVGLLPIRMEPVWMALGQAAGAAASLAASEGIQVRKVPIERLQRMLVEQGQVITYFIDVPLSHPDFAALQYFGARGFFPDFMAAPDAPLTRTTAVAWLARAQGKSNEEVRSLLQGRSGQAEKFDGEGELDRETAIRWVSRLYGKFPDEWHGNGPVRRGEFCRLLYALN
jgi:hypothetical protein